VTGNATVGAFTVGDINIDFGDNAVGLGVSASYYFDIDADADKGNGSAGAILFGDLNLTVGSNNTIDFSIDADVDAVTGAATIAGATIGNISGSAGLDACIQLDFDFDANGSKGDAIGDIVFGDVNLYGSAGASVAFELTLEADAGAVSGLTIGSVDMYVEDEACISFSLEVCGDSVGDIAIGDINLTLGQGASLEYFCIEASADKTSIGNVTFGNISIDGGIDSCDDSAYIYLYACNDIGDVTFGDVTIDAGVCASFTSAFDVCISAHDGGVGNVSVGNVSFLAAKDACICADFTVSAGESVGNVTIGDVAMDAATGADACWYVTVDASDEIGAVTIGDISVAAAKDGYAAFSVTVDGCYDQGDLSIGDIVVSASGKNASACFSYEQSGCVGDLGNVTLGDVSVIASKTGAYGSVSISITDYKNMGTVTVGDISVSANGKTAEAYFGFCVTAEVDIGQVQVGDIDISVTGGKGAVDVASDTDAQWGQVDIYVCAGDTLAGLTVGDISVTLANNPSASADVDGWLTIEADGGALTVGDISISAIEMTAGAAKFVSEAAEVRAVNFVSGTAEGFYLYGDKGVTVGDITVVGGYLGYSGTADKTGTVLDNFGTLTTLLNISKTSGDITVGDVDYSGYEAAASIDVSTWKGAANIMAAQDDTVIKDNVTKNVITLGDGDDSVYLLEGATTDESSEANIDEIINFEHGVDRIYIDTTSGAATSVSKTSGLATYADFLAWAATATGAGNDLAIGIVGSNTYVAIDKDNGSAVDFVIKFTGVTDIDSSDFSIS
jgi:hypothetical protein